MLPISDTKDWAVFFLVSITILTTIYHSKKTSINKRPTLDNSQFATIYTLSFVFAFLSVYTFNIMVMHYFPIIMEGKSLGYRLRHLGTVDNITTCVKYTMFSAPVLFFSRKFSKHFGLQTTKDPLRQIAITSIAFVFIIVGFYALTSIMPKEHLLNHSQLILKLSRNNFVLFLFTSAVVSFGSELFFRGFIYSALRERINRPFSAAIQAALVVSFPGGFSLGLEVSLLVFWQAIILCVLYEKTSSLIPSTFLHFVILLL